MKKFATPMILLAAICWGLIGFFSIHLADGGFNSIEITFLRCTVTAFALWMGLGIVNRSFLKISIKDLWMFIGTGVLSIVFFNTMYFMSIQYSNLSMAAILLYTAPAIVTVLSAILFKEKMTKQKISALILALIGCSFTSGIVASIVSGHGFENVSMLGVITGLASGLGYALYTIFGNVALKKYHTFTVTSYTFLIAFISLAPFCIRPRLFAIASEPTMLFNILGIGLISTLSPFLLYTFGLKYTEPSKASVMAFVEPMVATVIGVAVFKDELTIYSICGIVLIFLSICLLNKKGKS